ncbi:MAG: hypothetical protein EP330_11445 [Deltaproteobacteria bacterium]|nr:MAG: hypothetical protein EP330_11445 [Deltaproteobacteria bacterium]
MAVLLVLIVAGLAVIAWPRLEVALVPSDDAQLTEALSRVPLAEPGAQGPDIVLIVLDTVRKDRVSPYADDAITPKLARWASDARVFDQARAVSSWTLPSHASMFTGRYPTEHGAHGDSLASGIDAHGLSPEVPVVAEVLSEAGWATVGIAANRGYLRAETGLARGFHAWLADSLRPHSLEVPYPEGERVTDLALAALSAPRERPMFLFVNYMDAHMPYIDRREYYADPADFPAVRAPFTQSYAATRATGVPLDPVVSTSWQQGYDATLRYLDDEVGRLLEALPELGIDENDLVIVTSDHGEAFGEHGTVEHGKDLYDESIAVPLFVRGPGFESGRDARLVDHTDLPRWMLDAAGLPHLPGMVEDEVQLAELHYTRHKHLADPVLRARYGRVLRAYVAEHRKAIASSTGDAEVFDLAVDPGETRDARAEAWAPPLVERLHERFEQLETGEGGEITHSAEDLEHLRSLGYVE